MADGRRGVRAEVTEAVEAEAVSDLGAVILTRLSPWTVDETVSHLAPAEVATRHDLDEELAGRLAGIDAVTDAAIER